MSDQPFEYSPGLATGLVQSMSPARFARYLDATTTEAAALQLYRRHNANRRQISSEADGI